MKPSDLKQREIEKKKRTLETLPDEIFEDEMILAQMVREERNEQNNQNNAAVSA